MRFEIGSYSRASSRASASDEEDFNSGSVMEVFLGMGEGSGAGFSFPPSISTSRSLPMLLPKPSYMDRCSSSHAGRPLRNRLLQPNMASYGSLSKMLVIYSILR